MNRGVARIRGNDFDMLYTEVVLNRACSSIADPLLDERIDVGHRPQVTEPPPSGRAAR